MKNPKYFSTSKQGKTSLFSLVESVGLSAKGRITNIMYAFKGRIINIMYCPVFGHFRRNNVTIFTSIFSFLFTEKPYPYSTGKGLSIIQIV